MERAAPGIERGASHTRTENHATGQAANGDAAVATSFGLYHDESVRIGEGRNPPWNYCKPSLKEPLEQEEPLIPLLLLA